MPSENSQDPKDPSARNAEAGALLLPPRPPPPGTVRILFAKDSTWTMRKKGSVVQLDVNVGLAAKAGRRVSRSR
jgi:hypothetical protein